MFLRMPAGSAKVAVRRGAPCSKGAGHTRAASPKRTVRAITVSKPQVVQLAGRSKAKPGGVWRVARAQSRDPAHTVVTRPVALAPKAVPALDAGPAMMGKQMAATHQKVGWASAHSPLLRQRADSRGTERPDCARKEQRHGA